MYSSIRNSFNFINVSGVALLTNYFVVMWSKKTWEVDQTPIVASNVLSHFPFLSTLLLFYTDQILYDVLEEIKKKSREILSLSKPKVNAS